jgi:beta-glucosidase
MRDAVRMAVDAGVDVSMTPNDFGWADELVALVRDGEVDECRVDESVRRVLTLKAELGLLDHPYPDPALASRIGLPASRDAARQAARESIVLLENREDALPLRQGARVLVTGPAAHSLTALNGGWTYSWQGADHTLLPPDAPTLLDAIRARAGEVRHVGDAGGAFAEPTDAEIAAAVDAARGMDVAVVALGETGYAEWIGDIDDLTLPAQQLKLARAVQATGVPTVVVLLEGRPRVVRDAVAGAAAVVLGCWPGMEGGTALAEVLFGEVNPGGKLPFTYPRHPNALATYDHRHTEALDGGYVRREGGFDPQWAFGTGSRTRRSPTATSWSTASTMRPGERVTVTVTVTNTGARAGQEAVLLFTRQHYAAVTPSVRRLRAFDKVALEPERRAR